METKLKLKINNVSLSVSGSERFVNQAKKDFEAKYAKYFGKEVISAPKQSGKVSSEQPINNGTGMGITSYESKVGLNSKSQGPELLLVAGCWLTIEKSQPVFTRDELREAAKLANTFAATKHGKNLVSYVKSLVKQGKFISKGNGDKFAVDSVPLNEIKNSVYA